MFFDIVISNPPYQIMCKKLQDSIEIYRKQNFKTFNGTSDVYVLFYEKGIRVIKNKGFLCYITSNQWIKNGYGDKLRKFLLQYQLCLITNIETKIFRDAGVITNIILIKKETNYDDLLKFDLIEIIDKEQINFLNTIKPKQITTERFNKNVWLLKDNKELEIK